MPSTPCEDVMGNILLRISVWVVVVAAVFGNLAVMVVLMSGRFTMSVSKFLMCNLAFADFCMGVYLLLIALVDIRTMGYYFNYAIDWQNGYGCQLAGFITVFASELSIYSLTVITLERWYAITYAIHLNKRLKLSLAIKVMLAGWVYAIAMASLPLFGVSSYARTSICLPMDISETSDAAYLYTLLSVNALAFILISACYGKMYLSIVSQQTRATVSDTTVAKRMALLVFTDFACWAPIAFFGITAMAGYPLINVTKSKILLVFFYPLNSCANPFLYAILTKQYRRDFFILTSRYGFCSQRAMKYKGTSTNCHHRVASARGNNLHPASRSTLSQGSCDGHDGSSNGPRPRVAQCPGAGCQCPKGRTRCPEDSSNCSCRSIAYSTMEANLPIESSVSGESGHDVIGRSERRGQVSGCECNSATCTRHTRKRKEKKSRIKNLQHSFSSDEDEAGNPVAIAGNAASDKSVQSSSHGHSHQCRHHHHPPTHPQQAGHRLPPSERDCGQRRWLNMDTQLDSKANCRTPRTVSCTNIHKSHKNCASWVQRESSSSGEKTSHSCNGDMDGDSGGQWSRPKEPVAVLSSVRRSQADNLGFSSQPNGLYCESIM
ncbi:Lutropin-choriogonadotropic hormone receptor [Halotydeus destructor]|nr:Lutropin-choriogonadotropic hormone receptor [Halotydeus destructor]